MSKKNVIIAICSVITFPLTIAMYIIYPISLIVGIFFGIVCSVVFFRPFIDRDGAYNKEAEEKIKGRPFMFPTAIMLFFILIVLIFPLTIPVWAYENIFDKKIV